MPAFCRYLLAAAILAVAGCGAPSQRPYFSDATGWALCRDALPVDMRGFTPPPAGALTVEDRRANAAGAIAHAFALRCQETEALAERVRQYDRIVATGTDGAGVSIEPGPGTSLTMRLPAYADYRGDGFQADLRMAVDCFLAPGDSSSCPPA